eukprot:2900190-Amphidinium_carterae.1
MDLHWDNLQISELRTCCLNTQRKVRAENPATPWSRESTMTEATIKEVSITFNYHGASASAFASLDDAGSKCPTSFSQPFASPDGRESVLPCLPAPRPLDTSNSIQPPSLIPYANGLSAAIGTIDRKWATAMETKDLGFF